MDDHDAVIELLSDDEEYTSPHPLTATEVATLPKKKKRNKKSTTCSTGLQVGVVLEEDLHSTEPHPFLLQSKESALLFHDEEFESAPDSIEGVSRSKKVEKCRCPGSQKQPVQIRYIQKGPNKGRPYHACHWTKSQGGCMYFRWAFSAETLHWYRLGEHTSHRLVQPTGFSAQDLVQGKVGDCWFLSALAVVAERPDLIRRLFECYKADNLRKGLVQVNLFLDGKWKTVTVDNFLPCIISDKAEQELQRALNASIGTTTLTTTNQLDGTTSSSKYNPFALSDKNRQVLADTQNLLDNPQKKPAGIVNPYAKKPPNINTTGVLTKIPQKLNRTVTTEDLAYSKARHQQLWVPFLEKAYAKSHGCYQAISGGWMHEAFLDLTGAPTLQFALQSTSFDPKSFWYKLLSWRHQRLPMACATAQSQVGLIGMHAYSILDVVEIKNVSWEFFRDKLADRSLGNVSGFTELDGTVRLLRIRNPHGRGEWKGDFSDQSNVWEKLLRHSSGTAALERTMKNDGTFWMDYDSFLLGFSHVDVVLAFAGNHAKSFETNFPEKKSNQRCTRAFEICLVDDDNGGGERRDTVELYVMGIQKTKRGARHGRDDRKVSYKICDIGVLVGSGNDECCVDEDQDDYQNMEFTSVQGEMFGFCRNGHSRLILDRKKNKRLVVMPISFGHPAATDKERSWVVRFVADAPLLIRELPEVPRMDRVMRTYCFGPQPSFHEGNCQRQRQRKVLLEGPKEHGEPSYRVFQISCKVNAGGVVFVFLCVNNTLLQRKGIRDFKLHLHVEATCRGMMCRTETGFLAHETLAKGKKFEAAWRKYTTDVYHEDRSRLLMVLVQSGEDCEMGSVFVKENEPVQSSPKKGGQTVITATGKLATKEEVGLHRLVNYEKLGIFNGDSSLSDDQHASIFGPNPTGPPASVASSAAGSDAFDLELERALALSRGDREMQEVLALSKRDYQGSSSSQATMSNDRELQMVLERSMMETARGHSSKETRDRFDLTEDKKLVASACDNDLKEAIKRSLEETKQSAKAKSSTATGAGGAVVDLVETDDEDCGQTQPKQAKRKKTKNDEIEIVDIDDDDEEDTGAEVKASWNI